MSHSVVPFLSLEPYLPSLAILGHVAAVCTVRVPLSNKVVFSNSPSLPSIPSMSSHPHRLLFHLLGRLGIED